MELISVGIVHTDTTLGMLSTAVVSTSSALVNLVATERSKTGILHNTEHLWPMQLMRILSRGW